MPGDRVGRVIVLNGTSSAGKSSIARALQETLPGLWLTFGVDSFIDALPGRGHSSKAEITFRPGGVVTTGPAFAASERAWREGLAAMARAGAALVLDEVFLSGGATQTQLQDVFDGVPVCWVGVRCDPAVAATREAGRPGRVAGMAQSQAGVVHTGMRYDLEVDTTTTTADECARIVADHVRRSLAD